MRRLGHIGIKSHRILDKKLFFSLINRFSSRIKDKDEISPKDIDFNNSNNIIPMENLSECGYIKFKVYYLGK